MQSHRSDKKGKSTTCITTATTTTTQVPEPQFARTRKRVKYLLSMINCRSYDLVRLTKTERPPCAHCHHGFHHHLNSQVQSCKNKKMDSRGIEPRTTPRIEFEALCASEMLREYYTTKPRARGSSCYSFDGEFRRNGQYYHDIRYEECILVFFETLAPRSCWGDVAEI